MSTANVTAGTILVGSRALLNDQEDQIYHDGQLIPYLKLAFRELREMLEQSNIPVTNKAEVLLSVPAGMTTIGFFGGPPTLPADLVQIQQLWQRTHDTNPWFPMTRREFLPPQLEGIDYTEFIYWAWLDNQIHLLPSNQLNDLKVEYIKQLEEIQSPSDVIGIINGQTYLECRTAALAARFMMENLERAQELDGLSGAAADRLVNIENKAKQSIYTRRRPFRANWKSRTPF